ncbi:MAG: hypothetical protein JWR74_1674 [Polaromonas sp.]|nr:hypothetical protein [Polaromonas sp.]
MKNLNINPRLVEHVNASVEAIGINVKAHYDGSQQAYRSVAGELRKLLCDVHKKKDNSLILRFFPEMRFAPLNGPPDWIIDIADFASVGMFRTDGTGESEIEKLFDHNSLALPLTEWLNQKIFNKKNTLREIIKSVADKESAHADVDSNDTLSLLKGTTVGKRTLASILIIAIARYVVMHMTIRSLINYEQITPLLVSVQPSGTRGAIVIYSNSVCRHGIIPLQLDFILMDKILEKFPKMDGDADGSRLIDILQEYTPYDECVLMVQDLNLKDWNFRKLKWHSIETINSNENLKGLYLQNQTDTY